MNEEEMLIRIKELNFAVIDLALYLDTHSEDLRAVVMHQEYSKQLKEVKDKYQKTYGPLSIYQPCNQWRWIESPWPWGIRTVA